MKRTSFGVIAVLLLPATTPYLSAQPVVPPPASTIVQPAQNTAPAPEVTLATQAGAGATNLFNDNSATGLGGLMAGSTFYYLKPFMQGNTAFVTVTNPGTPTSSESSSSFNWNYNPAFAGWIGWTLDGGLGVRGRYFQFSADSETASISNGATALPGTQTTINPPLANLLALSTGGTAFGSPGPVLNSGVGTDQLTFSSSLTITAIDVEATYLWKGPCYTLLGSAGLVTCN